MGFLFAFVTIVLYFCVIMTIPGSEPLKNKKRETFCHEFLVDRNHTQAAIRAKYAEASAKQQGSRLMTFVDVANRIDYLTAKQVERTGIDADYVIKTITETIERCRQAEPVTDKQGNQLITTDQDGKPVYAFKFDSAAVLKGCELLGKHLKMFTDKVEQSGPNGGPITTDQNVTVTYVRPGDV